VISDSGKLKAYEVKYDKNQVKAGKYKLFSEAYPRSLYNLLDESF
jgi:hypothetical protein